MKTITPFALIACTIFFVDCKNRSVNCESSDIEIIDACLIGETVETAIRKLQTDSTHFKPHLFFYRQLYGIYIAAGDDALITLFVEKPFTMSDKQMEIGYRQYYTYILDQKITGVCWRKEKKRKVRTVGKISYVGCKTWY
jgi:hypothetical protein